MPKKNKTEAKIKNSEKELPVDFTAVKDETGEKYHAKTVEVESETRLEADTGHGQEMTLRFFEFAANPETFKLKQPTEQELFNAHSKQIQIELWKDEWQPIESIAPRILFSKDKTKYRIVVAAKPAKGSLLLSKTQTLTEIARGKRPENIN